MSVTTSSSGRKTFLTTNNPFEKKFGYHRAVRRGPLIVVSGTTAIDPDSGELEGIGDARIQATAAMRRCREAVEKLGGTLGDVVRVRMFVSTFEDTGAVGEAFKTCFGGKGMCNEQDEVGAAATMIVVKDGFVDADMLVEIEVDAVVW